MKKTRKKQLSVIIGLSLSLQGSIIADTLAVDIDPVSGSYVFTEDSNIEIKNNGMIGIRVSTNDVVSVADGSNAKVVINNNTTSIAPINPEYVYGIYADGGGKVSLKEVSITGPMFMGINTRENSEVIIGDNLHIESNYYVDEDLGSVGINTKYENAITKIGDNAYIKTAHHATQTVNGGKLYLGDNATLISENKLGILVRDASSEVHARNNLTITSNQESIQADRGGKVYISDNATLTSLNGSAITAYDANSEVNIGNGLTVTANYVGVFARDKAKINIGNNANLTTTINNTIRSTGAEAQITIGNNLVVNSGVAGIYTDAKAKVLIGNDAKISSVHSGIFTDTESIVEVRDNLISSSTSEIGITAIGKSQIKIGSNAQINSDASIGIHSEDKGTKVEIGDNATITSVGPALFAVNGGKITVGDNISLATSPQHADAIYVMKAGTVELKGATIRAEDATARVICITDPDSTITGKGKYDIIGNIEAYNSSIIDLNMLNSSMVEGQIGTDNTGVIKLKLSDNSRWNVTGNSNLSILDNNNSIVDMTADNKKFSKIYINKLSGNNGLFKLDIDGTAVNQNDKIYITDTFSGTQIIDLKEIEGRYVDSTLEQKAAGTILASVNNNNGIFTALDGEGTLFYNRYILDQQASTENGYTTDWYLKAIERVNPEEKPTTTVEGAVSSTALAFHMWRDNDKLMQRMGDLRKNGEEEKGFWVRMKRGQLGRDGKFGFENQFNHFEIGYDKVIDKTDKYTRYGGLSFGYTDGTSSYDRGTGENKNKALSFYMTEIRDKGQYLDLVLKVNRMDTDFSLYNEDMKKINGDFNNTGVSFSAEYGYKKELSKNGWYIEPQVQLKAGYLDGDSYTTNNNVKINQDGMTSVLARVGFNIGKDIGKRSHFYVKANLLHEFCGDYAVAMQNNSGSTVKIDQDFSDTWFEYGLGFTFKNSSNSSIYFDVERMTGGDFDKDWQWNAGVRWTF